ncbi:hypothetical protein [Nocardioides coralli]|uniref:hypothetical protein n=1 Tax=Nocardioides coralli TaxID=2872154 RepID=UPI001CA3F6A5|nr:hypothetical protein [Nocardioides coralli]QZY29861.1 hypothetical protein K6T13_04005 [Nocardioides coralli]
MLMSGTAVVILIGLVVLIGVVFVTIRVMGGRAVRGDHPGEAGYDPGDHQPT